jgi:hypothetical protein
MRTGVSFRVSKACGEATLASRFFSGVDGAAGSLTPTLSPSATGLLLVFAASAPASPEPLPLTFLDEAAEFVAVLCALPNQCGKPCRRLNPPGGNLSSSVALTGSSFEDPVVKV